MTMNRPDSFKLTDTAFCERRCFCDCESGGSACETDKSAEEEITHVWEFVKSRVFDLHKTSKQKLTA